MALVPSVDVPGDLKAYCKAARKPLTFQAFPDEKHGLRRHISAVARLRERSASSFVRAASSLSRKAFDCQGY
jgi:hypothetical protein